MAPPPPMAQPALPPMREVTEDTPPDMLAGAMDLRVLLPDGHAVKMNVDRSTPMMDLLVHVTTANKMSPGSHLIQAVGEKGNILPYKPSTPIGALDTWTIQIVSKSKANVIGHKKAPFKPSNKPFEQTFRLQVNLPRNQLFVTRVSPRTPLLEVLRHVCSEKGLDPDKYELRNPMNPDEVLRLTCNLLDYKLQEVTVALRGSTTSQNHHSHHRVHPTTAADIISLQQQHQQLTESSEKRRKSSGSTTAASSHSGGVFGFIFKRSSRSSVCEGSISSDSLGGQSISPARSDESLGPARSASPPLSQTTSRSSTTQDHLRNQINSRMNRRQENSCCPVSVLKESAEQMEENQPPPPPVRQRKRRAPKPPVQHQAELSSGSKKTSEFITPDPPSIPAPIPVSRRKSASVEDEEYNEEVVRSVSGGRKVKIEGGGTSGTVISHSRNSSDSSGYHEASVLSESPESGLGGSGAPDTLPRRKPQSQLQQQRAAASASSQIPAFSRSMGNLASVAPPPSSTSSSNTLISTSYSSLSISTSSLPSQKKKKAPAPPPPASSKKQQNNEELNVSKTATSNNLFERTRHDSYKEELPQLDRETVQKPKLINYEVPEPSKPNSIVKEKESASLHVNLPVSIVDQKTNASMAVLPPVVAPLASKPASASKLGPAVAPKPKVNTMGKPGLNSSGPFEDAPIPKPRSKQPLSKKHIAPSPAPRSKAPVIPSEEKEPAIVSKECKAFNITPGSSPLLKEEELGDTIDLTNTSNECGNHLGNGEDQDELNIDDLNLKLFDGGATIVSSNYEEQNEEKEEEEEFDETVIQNILTKHQRRSFADLLNYGQEELILGDTELEVCSKSEGCVAEGNFSLETNREDDLSSKAEPLSPKSDLSFHKYVSTNFSEGNKKIHQVESALNFSNFSREGKQEDFGRLSSNSLCSEVDMPFATKATRMNRWRNMEALNHSSSSVDIKDDFKNSVVEEDDSSNWVVGSESDNEAGEASEAAREEDVSDFANKTDPLHIQENLNYVGNGGLEIRKKLEVYETVKEDGVCTVLPSPPPSLEYMSPVDGVAQEEKGEGTYEDLEWEYKLPAPPTGFEDEEERTAEEVKEDTWVAESASLPSTFSSSHQKVWLGEGKPLKHLPNFKMRTCKAPSSEGWEDPRELSNENNLEKRSGSMFAMLNSDNIEREADRVVDKNYLETWASVSSRSSVTSAPSSSVHTLNIASHTNSGYKEGEKNRLAKNGSYVVRVSSFGGKSSMNLKRSLSSTSSIYSRHNEANGKEASEKLDRECVASMNIKASNESEGGQSLSNATRTVSLHDLAVKATEEESISLTNGYHKENTTPKIVSSTWKKPQGGDPPEKYPSPVSHNLRKTSSELSISQAGLVNGWKGAEDEDHKVVRLQQQFLHWHEQMLLNKSTLDGSVSLKSLQVLRGVLPQLNKSLSSDLANKDAQQTYTAKRKDNDQGKADVNGRIENGRDEEETLHTLSTNTGSTFAPRPNNETSSIEAALQEAPKRYSYAGPPSINFGTWSERPKSEVSLKCDSDYRIGVGQATRAKEPSVHIAQNVNKISHHEPAPPCPPPKPSNHIVVNVVSAAKQEPISRLPIVRSVEFKKTSTLSKTDRPLSGSFLNDLREELTGALASLVDANRNGMTEEGNERRRRQQIPSSAAPPPPPDVTSVVRLPNQTTSLRRLGSTAGTEYGPRLNGYGGNEKRHTIAPVVKGFRVNSVAATNVTNNQCQPPQPPPAPLPPPAVVCGVALKKKPESSAIPKFSENPRDQLLMAIREFGGRESLKKTAMNYK